jgi:ubiquinone/menaquinone biosynthesis C-methylase UbiE
MKNKYGQLSTLVYETDKPVGVSFGDVAYYLERLRDVKGPILEPGVGNGRFLVPLLQANKTVVGYDASPHMLEVARSTLQQHQLTAELVQSDFASYQSALRFDAIVIPAGTFQLIDSFETARTVLGNFYQQLNVGGRLMLDLDAAQAIFTSQPSMRKWQVGEHSVVTLASTPLNIDYANQVSTELHRYELWENGQLQRTELEEFVLRWWSASEISMALQLAGFTNVVVSGGYEYGRAPQSSDELISVEGTKN